MPTQQQWLIGLAAFALLVIVVILIVKRPFTAAAAVENAPVATAEPAVVAQPPEPSASAPLQETTASEHDFPPMPAANEAPSAQSVESHRAELMRGTALARARVSAPTTSALIMNSALTGRDHQGSRQNIGETAMMDRLTPGAVTEAAPW